MRTAIPFVAQISAKEKKVWLEALHRALPEQAILPLEELTVAQRVAAEIAIVANPEPAHLATLPNLQWVQSLWAGVETLLAATQGAKFAIVRMTDPQLAETMAEAVLAWTLYLHRDMPRYRAQQTVRTWQQHPLQLPSQRTVGLLGLGNLGKAAAQKLVQHGFTVWGWSRGQRSLAGVNTVSGDEGFIQILQHSDILVCLLPFTRQTRQLLNQKTLRLLPTGASFINFARGAIVDTGALMDALNSGGLSHAVLDVFEEEPLPPKSPLWSHPGITVLPHISAPTHKPTAALIAAQNIREFLRHGHIPPRVDRTLGY
ncbi:MAG: glyoxylate/hydroxypyruvate reductase A [Leptolyngbya sp. SIO1E4]|nr:glyoxylate/hydroxypyruvate reductase A [Leptolyngbya sp. SIO1E4]